MDQSITKRSHLSIKERESRMRTIQFLEMDAVLTFSQIGIKAEAKRKRPTHQKMRVRFITKPLGDFKPKAGGEWVVTTPRPSYAKRSEFDAWCYAMLWARRENQPTRS